MLKKFIALYFACISISTAFSQSLKVIKNDGLLLATLQQNKFDVDSNAKAVYLYKSGSYSIVPGTTYTEEVVIKILSDDAAKDLSWVNISKSDYSNISNIKGETYNLENGEIVVQKMKGDEIKNENIIEDFKVYKFNLPSVKKGSIIHYSYKRYRDASVFIPDWYGQENYPVLYEEFSVASPGTLTKYHKLERFFSPFSQLRNSDGLDTCIACSYSEETGTGFNIKWVRRNVPAFKKEPFMESEYNYRERIRFQFVNIYTNWEKYIYAIFMGEDHHFNFTGNPFPKVYQSNPYLNDKVEELTLNIPSDLEKAKVIFKFVRDSFNVKNNLEDNTTLKDIYKSKQGNQIYINLILTAMLRNAGLNCEPALLGTRTNEKLNPYYQDLQNVDYYISRLTIGKEVYCLDASDKNMPFGKLNSNCYNGHARTINKVSRGFELTPNDIVNKSATIISIKPSDDNKKLMLKGDYKLGDYDAFTFRTEMKNDSIAIRKQIIEDLSKDGIGFELTDLKIENLRNPDAALVIHINAEMELDAGISILYFDPFFDKIYDKNPFAAVTRQYPIQMDYLEDKNYVFSFQLPDNYVLDDYPKSIQYQYDDSSNISIKNMASFDPSQSLFSLNTRFISKTTTFSPDSYANIREFYNKVIEVQNEKIVLKEKNK